MNEDTSVVKEAVILIELELQEEIRLTPQMKAEIYKAIETITAPLNGVVITGISVL